MTTDKMIMRSADIASETVSGPAVVTRPRRPKRLTKLTARDLDILEFLTEMKFSNLSQLHRKFFSKLENGMTSQSETWAQERMRGLRKLGLVELKPVFLNQKYFYIATPFGQECLQNLRPERTFVRAIDEIDHRNFVHDWLVIESRLALEDAGRAAKWMSERRLKSESSLQFGLAREYQPDALYENRNGDIIAFELENFSKARARYEDKIRKYVHAIALQAPSQKKLRAVLFVVVNEANFQTLVQLTNPYPDKFKIERYSDLVRSQVGIARARMNLKSTNQNGGMSNG